MNLIKYGIYIGAIVIVALLFEKIMTFFYDLTLNGLVGDLTSYLYLTLIWLAIFIIARGFLDKKMHPKSSQFALLGGGLHIGLCLAIYFYNTQPLYLLIFPVIIVIGYWMHQNRSTLSKGRYKLRPTHPEFVDERGGTCVFRAGSQGFTILKFFEITPPIPIKEFLLYLFHELVECTFEIRNSEGNLSYYLTVIAHGRNYDITHRHCMEQSNRLRQFFRQERMHSVDVNDVLNALCIYYAPYFLHNPTTLDEKGIPTIFPKLSSLENELIIEQGYDERTFTIHVLHPTFEANNLYSFLENLDENYYLQLHFRPLSSKEITEREDRFNQEYRDSLKRLTNGLEGDTEFQAASYLFSSVGRVSKENLEPLLDQSELTHLKEVKQKMQHIKVGRKIGLWAVDFYLMGNPVIAQTLAVKLNGIQQILIPHAFAPLACRKSLGYTHFIDSKELSTLLPQQSIQENPAIHAATPARSG
ncbi:MAG: hypothetical protein ACFFD2_16470 [Promethearchaeota archaeon]